MNRRKLPLVLCFGVILVGWLAVNAQASFPGRDGRILVTRQSGHQDTLTLWSVSPTSGSARRLTKVPRRCRGRRNSWQDFDGSFSSSGRRIVYVHYDDCDRRLGNGIYVIRSNGRGRRRLFRDRGEPSLYSPTFSPNGKRVAVERYGKGGRYLGIYMFRTRKPRRPVRVASRPAEEPAWGATNRLLFSGARGLVILDSPFGRGRPRRTALTHRRSDGSPDWSPDGKQVVFTRWGGVGAPATGVWTIASDRSAARQLTSVPWSSLTEGMPVWSPNGREIAYLSEHNPYTNQAVVYLMNANGTHRRRLIGPVDFDRLSWQPR